MFTWLAKVAQGYEMFTVESMTVVYTPTCASTTSGVIVMAFDYNASDAAPTTKQAISAYSGSTRGNVWNRLTLQLRPPKSAYYVGIPGSVVQAGADIKFYDVAKFYLGVFNQSAAYPVGELSVNYRIKFYKPEVQSSLGFGTTVAITGGTINQLAGTSSTQVGNLPLKLANYSNGMLSINVPLAGYYLMEVTNAFATASQVTQPLQGIILNDPPGVSNPSTVTVGDMVVAPWSNPAVYYSGMTTATLFLNALATIVLQMPTASTNGYINFIRLLSAQKGMT
jgi:hypothetical protein